MKALAGCSLLVRFICLLALGALLWAAPCQAGNKKMVNKTIEELDQVNKEAVGKIDDLPPSGKVNLKAKVSNREGKRVIEIVDKKVQPKPEAPSKVTPAVEIIERNIDFNKAEKIPQGPRKAE